MNKKILAFQIQSADPGFICFDAVFALVNGAKLKELSAICKGSAKNDVDIMQIIAKADDGNVFSLRKEGAKQEFENRKAEYIRKSKPFRVIALYENDFGNIKHVSISIDPNEFPDLTPDFHYHYHKLGRGCSIIAKPESFEGKDGYGRISDYAIIEVAERNNGQVFCCFL